MSVLTEITNSDKDILLSGDCTIKTKLITSKERLPIQIYDGIYDSQNDSYHILGESTQKTRSGKNLFDKNATGTLIGVNKSVLNTGVRITLTSSSNYRYISINVGGSELLGKTLTFGGIISPSSQNSGSITLYFGSSSNTAISFITNQSSSGSKTITIPNEFPSGANEIHMLLYGKTTGEGNIGDYVDYTNLMLVIGNSLGDYEDYGVMPSPDYPSEVKSISGVIGVKTKEDTVVVVDLEDNELCGITAKDKLTIKDGKATITKNIDKIVLDGNESTWHGLVSEGFYITTTTWKNKSRSETLTNYFQTFTVYRGGLADADNGAGFLYPTINQYYLKVDGITTQAELKTWLSTHNTSVYYELSTPQEITLTNVNTYTIQTLTEENSVKDWAISDDRYVENNGVIGQFVARDISGNLQNISDNFNIENKRVQVQMGISQFKSSTTNWYSFGTFIIMKPSDDEVSDNTKYNGYDLATLFNIDFNADFVNGQYPKSFNQMLEEQKYVTNKWLANYACAQAEVELATQDFIHNDFQVLSNQFTSGESCRDVMKYISQLAFGYCEIGWDDKCYIRTLSNDYSSFDDYHKLNYDTYYSLETQKNEYGPVNRVFCGLQDVNGQGATAIDESTIENGATTIDIYNNPLVMGTSLEISTQLQLQAIKGCEVLWGIKYRPITTTETIGHPWFKANEPIQVSDMENNTFITYPFNHTIKYTGHIKSEISSEGETKTEDTYGYKDSIERRINRIGINVDKANEKITIVNQKISNIDGEISTIKGQIIDIGDTYTKSEIQDIVNGTGVDGVVVTSLETATTIFDINGMTIGRTDTPTKTNINANGMIITNANNGTELLKINNSGVYSENLTARTYLNFGTHGRFEKYTVGNQTRIGCFWIEGDD